MYKNYFSLVFILFIFNLIIVKAQTTYVPDNNFEQALIDLGYDDVLDDYVLTTNISSVKKLYISDKNISDLTGIQNFKSLRSLRCFDNKLTTLDISQNIELRYLKCHYNRLTKLDVSNNKHLINLLCKGNEITELDLSQNTALSVLNCEWNRIASLDLSQNTALTILMCRRNVVLSSLDLSQNTALSILNCEWNAFVSIDISQNTALSELNCSGNNLSSLDVSRNKVLSTLVCRGNSLSSLDVSQNTALTLLDCRWNNILECILVDNADDANAEIPPYDNWLKDASATYSEECTLERTYIPDNNFEQALIDLGHDDLLDDFALTSTISKVHTLIIQNKGIKDLTGIENFTSLVNLYIDDNQLVTLDMTQNTDLYALHIARNQLTNLNVSQNNSLIRIYCKNNQLTSLDVSKNNRLYLLDFQNNKLSSLNLKNGSNTNITHFYGTGNPDLTCIEVDDPDYSKAYWTNVDPWTSFSEDCHYGFTNIPDDNFEQALIDLGHDDVLDNYVLTSNISSIVELNVADKNITELTGIQDFESLEALYCKNNQIINLDLSQNKQLKYLKCHYNAIQSLNISRNSELEILNCRNNAIEDLNVEKNAKLKVLNCLNNNLTDLNISQNSTMTTLYCGNNRIRALNLSKNKQLEILKCNNNWLTFLNVNNDANSLITDFDASGGNQLNCILVDNADDANAGLSPYDNWKKNPNAYYCENPEKTHMPDDNFEQALIDQGYDDVLDNYILTSNISGITELYINNQGIEDLAGIEGFTSLQELGCDNNQLVSLDLTQNTELLFLDCSINPLINLNVTQNIHLDELFCGNTQLTNLDLSKNGGLFFLNCNYTLLTRLNLKNKSLQDYSEMNMGYNPHLVCIEVDNEDYINSPEFDLPWYKDDHTIYANDCNNVGKTNITDNNFEQALIDLGYDDVLDGYVLTVNISKIVELDISSKNINDLTGLQNFKSLRSLKCNDNQLVSLDVSQNIELRNLRCQENQLTSLDLSKNKALGSLSCRNNPITALDLSQNTALTLLRCSKTQLAVLDLSENSKLEVLVCSQNTIVSLNVKNGANYLITDFNAMRNPNLNCIQIDNANDAISGTVPYDSWSKDAMATYSEDCSYPAQAKTALNIEKEVLSDVITLYPNPVTGILNIDSGSLSLIKIEIYSILGQKIKEISADFNAIEISDLSSGIYLISLYSKKGISMKKIIKE